MASVNQTDIEKLSFLLKLASTIGIERLVIGNDMIRGIDEGRTAGIVMSTVKDDGTKEIDLNSKTVAITRVKMLLSRLNVIKTQGDLKIETEENGNDIVSLNLSGGKSKTTFRCATVDSVKGVPKSASDVMTWEIEIPSSFVSTLIQADASIASDGINFNSDNSKLIITMTDSNNDNINFEFDENDPVKLIGSGTNFSNKYPSKSIITLFKEAAKFNDVIKLKMGVGGLLMISIDSFEFFIVPMV